MDTTKHSIMFDLIELLVNICVCFFLFVNIGFFLMIFHHLVWVVLILKFNHKKQWIRHDI
jgi:hypothetical protein